MRKFVLAAAVLAASVFVLFKIGFSKSEGQPEARARETAAIDRPGHPSEAPPPQNRTRVTASKNDDEAAATAVQPASDAGRPRPAPLTPAQIEEKRHERQALIDRHISNDFIQDGKSSIHWLNDVSGILSDQAHLSAGEVLFVESGIQFIRQTEQERDRSGGSTYQAIYDAKHNRPGVVTGIIVMTGEGFVNPERLGQIAGIRYSSSRPETGIHFFSLPEGPASRTEQALRVLRQQPGVVQATLATVFDRKVAM